MLFLAGDVWCTLHTHTSFGTALRVCFAEYPLVSALRYWAHDRTRVHLDEILGSGGHRAHDARRIEPTNNDFINIITIFNRKTT